MKATLILLGLSALVALAVGQNVCTADSDCSQYGENASCQKVLDPCDTKMCNCKSGYAFSGTKCEKWRKVGESCSGNEVCAGSSTCSGGTCTCQSNTVANSDKNGCEIAAKSGWPKWDEDCPNLQCSEGTCVDGKCGCPAKYEKKDDFCWPTSATLSKGDTCTSSSDPDKQLCKWGLSCGYCPGDTTSRKCLKGGVQASAQVSMVLLMVAMLVAVFQH